jgi:hypothetical protein
VPGRGYKLEVEEWANWPPPRSFTTWLAH